MPWERATPGEASRQAGPGAAGASPLPWETAQPPAHPQAEAEAASARLPWDKAPSDKPAEKVASAAEPEEKVASSDEPRAEASPVQASIPIAEDASLAGLIELADQLSAGLRRFNPQTGDTPKAHEAAQEPRPSVAAAPVGPELAAAPVRPAVAAASVGPDLADALAKFKSAGGADAAQTFVDQAQLVARYPENLDELDRLAALAPSTARLLEAAVHLAQVVGGSDLAGHAEKS